MPSPNIEPITEDTLTEFAQFLHANLQQNRSQEEWAKCLRVSWYQRQPNYGFALRDNGEIVGGIGAYYVERIINGQMEKICNITSWCVLDKYRQQSMKLAMAITSQPGYHFTDFSPTKIVGGTLRFLKFRPLDERQAVIPNLPSNLCKSIEVLDLKQDIEQSLESNALQTYLDHSTFPWLIHALVGKPNAWCHVIFKRRVFKGLSAAEIYYISDKDLFDRYRNKFSTYLLFHGYMITLVECRLLKQTPKLSAIRSGFNAKLFLSTTLAEQDIDYLYSETMALDL